MYFEKEILDKIPTECLLASFEAAKIMVGNNSASGFKKLTDEEIVKAVFRPNLNDWLDEQKSKASHEIKQKSFNSEQGRITDEKIFEFNSFAYLSGSEEKMYDSIKTFSMVWRAYLKTICESYFQYLLTPDSTCARINVFDEYSVWVNLEEVVVFDYTGSIKTINHMKDKAKYDRLFKGDTQSNNNSDDDKWDK